MSKQAGQQLLAQAIRVGENLPVSVYADNGMLLLGRGHYVLTEAQRARLLAHSENAPAQQGAEAAIAGRAPANDAPRTLNPFEELLHLARRLNTLLAHPLATSGFEEKVRALASDIERLARRAPDAMIASLLLAPIVRYASMHSVHVALLAALIAQRLPLDSAEREALLCAALTMNIAVPGLMDTLHGQQAPLTPPQREEIDAHPLLGSAILRESGVADARWHTLVQQHHERQDGTGYPLGQGAGALDALVPLLQLCDVVAAKLTPRSYRCAQLPQLALRQVFSANTGQDSARFVALMVKELGIYPPGSFVRLANGEIGVVLARRDKATEPFVAALRKENGPPYGDPLLRETRQASFAVSCAVAPQAAGVRTAYLSTLWRTTLPA